jgi:putative ABC transport system permease protein
MFGYYAWLAARSLKRNWVLTTLMIAAVGLGIGALMTSLTIFHLMSGDPIPHKSDRLFAVYLDSWEPESDGQPRADPTWPSQLTWRDASHLAAAGQAKFQTMMFRAAFAVQPENTEVKPYTAVARMTYADFFPMFEPPFAFGGPWTRAQDAERAKVTVLSKATNDRLFGGEDSVGRKVRFGDHQYTVIGVLAEWDPRPRYYDVVSGWAFETAEEFYLPLTLNDELKLRSVGNNSCWKSLDEPSYEGYLASECVWTQFWVELDSATDRERYLAYLDAYVGEQKTLGRFPAPLNNKLYNVIEWLDVQNIISSDVYVTLWIAFAFLLVCLLNMVGLLLAKFLGRSGEIGVRRALGASRRQIFAQYLIEAGAIGVAGSVLGLALAGLGLAGVSAIELTDARLATLDPTMVATAIAASIAAALLAGLYPTWRACQIAPALQLKSN